MATVGEVLLMWGFLERAMRERLALRQANAKPRAKSSTLIQWRKAEEQAKGGGDLGLIQLFAEIEKVAMIRNYLAHGLSSASADPRSNQEAAVVCVMPDGRSRRLTWTEMQVAKDHLHTVTNRVRDLAL
ncbi:hypothetical protein [Mesorhizobium sp.]|nr:hypothetical protein [Mesorhizobium sp.]TIO72902.1 MAG: hypothetical protein E5X75_30575 [Mesorhizobium sp.]